MSTNPEASFDACLVFRLKLGLHCRISMTYYLRLINSGSIIGVQTN